MVDIALYLHVDYDGSEAMPHFYCHSDRTLSRAPGPIRFGVNNSYTYLGAGLNLEDLPVDTVIAHCHPMHHGGKVPVAFADGRVRIVEGDELRQLLPGLLPAE